MFRVVAKSVSKITAAPVQAGARSFSVKLDIPTDKEQQAVRRKEEIDAAAVGEVAFNRDPIIPAADAGTKENPILVS